MPALRRHAWSLGIRGAISIVLGLAILFFPDLALQALVLLFAALAIGDGVVALLTPLAAGRWAPSEWPLLLEGVAGIAVGAAALLWPDMTVTVLVLLFATWLMVTGGLAIVGAARRRWHVHHVWLLVLDGVLAVAFGLIAIVQPGLGAIALVAMMGLYAISAGVLQIYLAARLRGFMEDLRLPAP